MPPRLDDLMTVPEAAKALDVNARTVNRWASEGELPTAYQVPGYRGARLFKPADVERLARARAKAAAKKAS